MLRGIVDLTRVIIGTKTYAVLDSRIHKIYYVKSFMLT